LVKAVWWRNGLRIRPTVFESSVPICVTVDVILANLDVIDKSMHIVNCFQKSRQYVRSTNRGEEFERRVRLTVRPLIDGANNRACFPNCVLNIVTLITGASL